MTVVAVTMVKDEADIIERSVRNMVDQTDAVIVADNMSTDDTRAILERVADECGNVVVVDDFEVGYRQSEKMTALAGQAADEFGADWIVPFDADEIWCSPFGRIGDVLDGVASQWLTVPARVFDHVATGEDPDDPDPVRRLRWRRVDENPLPKVACRWRDDLVIEMGNHGASYDGDTTEFDPLLVVRHFPNRSAQQLIRKIRNGYAAYQATDLPDHFGTHWREWGEALNDPNRGAAWVADLFTEWYYRPNPRQTVVVRGETLPPLIYDPVR